MRLTKKTPAYKVGEFNYPEGYDYAREENGFTLSNDIQIMNKLGQLEDLMESYEIKSIEDLNVILAEYFCNIIEHSITIKGEK